METNATITGVMEYVAITWIPSTNMFLILAILTNGKMRKKKSALLILNQAFADFLVGSIMAYNLDDVYYATFGTDISDVSQRKARETACLVLVCLHSVFAICSATTMVMINLERYLLICHIFWYRNILRYRHILCMVLFPWVVSLALTIPWIMKDVEVLNKNVYNQSDRMLLCYDESDAYGEEIAMDSGIMFFCSVVYCLISLPAIIVFNVKIIKTAYQSSKQRINSTNLRDFAGGGNTSNSKNAVSRSTSNSQDQEAEQKCSASSQLLWRRSMKNIRTLVTFNIFFLIMWLPLVMFTIVTSLAPSLREQDKELYRNIRYALGVTAYLNSGVNPFLWLMYPEFKDAYWQLLNKCGLRYCKKPTDTGLSV